MIAVVGFKKDYEKLHMIANIMKDSTVLFWSKNLFKEIWGCKGIVALMPTGIIIREIAPLLKNKWTDTPVIAVDKTMTYAIPLIGGHHGANDIAYILSKSGLIPVITTSMEYSEGLSIGIGCDRGVNKEEILNALKKALDDINADLKDIRVIVTTDLKKNEEGLIDAVDEIKKPLIFLEKNKIEKMNVKESKARLIGLKSVADASALYFGKELIYPKKVYGRVTIAIAR
ncbi:MAG: cobalamin biosynthesis protein [Candidatus Methanoliparum thermophilum]|uniref:Cobalamin biosynthesis protein n=1 Tax=Methanoliparum thermophilum TaxID=2491083 RepID=A0A520KT45_METT2|nr:cobalamin biosynthesis protein [Candidatus Methanoliparum sp. LAM-1]RZN65054.1 MAG: cobalamin biosynthesis protein [Candidatus Methanoliparum thermophilum]BDC36054.1 cobalamin biosynthesis protein [Candidatus Methanoliparum sp. LAM-1]